MLISRRTFPPGGYQYFQPQTGWSARPGATFDEVVRELIHHRMANPRFNLSTDFDTVANELDEFTCIRLAFNPNYCTHGNAPPFLSVPPPQPQSAGHQSENAAAGVKKYARNTAAGIGLYLEWFGTGKPVNKEEAEKRAALCVQCPKHVKGNFMQRFNQLAATEIMTVFGILNDLELHTSKDSQLALCDPCDCPVKAKVWSPLDIILKHLRPEAKAGLWEKCWMTNQ